MEGAEVREGVYEHYKGKKYRVLGIARHSETLEKLVVYQALYTSEEFGDDSFWVRPLAMFLSDVRVDGEVVPRFKYIREK